MSPGEVLLWTVAGGGLGGRLLALRGLGRIFDPRWRLDPAPVGRTSQTFVSVCVPARDEAHNLPTLLDSLVAQDHAAFEVIVVDDHSSDGTAEVVRAYAARDSRVKLVEGGPLRPGWTGKTNALDQAVAHARGEVLLFVDADTWHNVSAVRTVALQMDDGLDVLVVLSGQRVPTLVEQVVNPFFWGFLLSLVDPAQAEDPRCPDSAMGNGQFAAFRREPYFACGGHGAVRDRIIEDVALVRVLTRAGARYRLRLGPALTNTRMYEDAAAVWRGFSKNAAFVDPHHKGRDAALTLIAVLLMAQAELWPLAGVALGGGFAVAGILQAAAVLWGRSILYRKLVVGRISPVAWVLQPVGGLVGCLIVLNSLRLGLGGRGAIWKGRAVSGPSV